VDLYRALLLSHL